jgi:hypothetical protein
MIKRELGCRPNFFASGFVSIAVIDDFRSPFLGELTKVGPRVAMH